MIGQEKKDLVDSRLNSLQNILTPLFPVLSLGWSMSHSKGEQHSRGYVVEPHVLASNTESTKKNLSLNLGGLNRRPLDTNFLFLLLLYHFLGNKVNKNVLLKIQDYP